MDGAVAGFSERIRFLYKNPLWLMQSADDCIIPAASRNGNQGFRKWLRQKFVAEKMNNFPGILFLLLMAVFIAWLVYAGGVKGGALFLAAITGIPFVIAAVAWPPFGIMAQLILAYFVFEILRMDLGIPAGTLADGVEALLILGFFISQKKHKDWEMFRQPVGIMILIWIGYNVLEFANPAAESRMAWVYTIRSVALVMLTYFIFMLQIRTVQFLRLIIHTWVILATLVCLYGLKQEFIGFSPAEDAWLHSDPKIADLLFIAGAWRKFSFLSDPVVFAYTMVVSSAITACLAMHTHKYLLKLVYIVLTVLFLFSMLFSGTRGAYVMVPAGIVFYGLLNMSRKVFIAMLVMGFLTAVLIFIPSGNPTIVRFQSAFKPAEDASFTTRKNNQKRIRPYIYSHPLGGGLGATGVWGQRFAPNSFLASFPPDSGYVRVAVEMGWIGLLLMCMLMFVILKTGIDNYYRIRDPELKTYCLAMLLVVFMFNIGNYPQEALVQFPSNIYFYLAVAILGITYKLDREKQSAA
jgi:putative inorganic carbon (HCO3(-)) transporter